MFETFPIICLSDQKDVINQAIIDNHLSQEDILWWLRLYGYVVNPDEEHSIRYSLLFLPVHVSNSEIPAIPHRYIYLSYFGFVIVFRFIDTENQIGIFRPLGGLPWEVYRHRKWVARQ